MKQTADHYDVTPIGITPLYTNTHIEKVRGLFFTKPVIVT